MCLLVTVQVLFSQWCRGVPGVGFNGLVVASNPEVYFNVHFHHVTSLVKVTGSLLYVMHFGRLSVIVWLATWRRLKVHLLPCR